jgi:hypothetical protein
MLIRPACTWCVAWLTFAALSGCGGSVEGPPRFAVSGKVAFKGAPVPFGEISFQPDSGKGNSGPGVASPIRDGAYSVEQKDGLIGGPHIVRIIGFDGPPADGAAPAPGSSVTAGKPLFREYKTEMDVPKKDSSQDFTVTE